MLSSAPLQAPILACSYESFKSQHETGGGHLNLMACGMVQGLMTGITPAILTGLASRSLVLAQGPRT